MRDTLQTGRWWRNASWLPILMLLIWGTTATAQSADALMATAGPNLLSNGGFEVEKPAYWSATGEGAVWDMEAARTPGTSLMLSGAGEAMWAQEEAVLNWSTGVSGNEEFVVGGWVTTNGVNTAPASDAEKFQLGFEFYNATGVDLLGGPLVIDVPQDVASSDGWVEINNTLQGALTLPEMATSVKIWFKKGADAVGSVNLDDVFIRGAGGWFNPNMDAGDTWYYWWDAFESGKDDWPDNQPFFLTVTDEEVHSGNYALLVEQNDPEAAETVAISQRVPVTPGEPVLVSYWLKTMDVLNPDSVGTADYNVGMTALWYSSMESGAAGYNEIGGLDIRLNGEYNPNVIPLLPREESSGWTQYAFVVYPADEAVGMEMRLRYWHHFEGATYWDDVFIAPVPDVLNTLPNLLSNGGFEVEKPAYWTPTGDGAVWEMPISRTPYYSLKLSGAGEAMWAQEEAILNWSTGVSGNEEFVVGGWIKTDGVNTFPSRDAEKYQLGFEFYNATGVDLLGGPLVIDVPQDAAASDGWVEIDNTSQGALTLPETATSVKIWFKKGADAAGVAYLDDVFIRGAGGWFNPNMDTGDTWYYWWDAFGSGSEDWPASLPFIETNTMEQAHSGVYSQKLMQNDPEAAEAVVISERVPITAGEPVLVSYWVKTDGVLHPDSVGTADYNIGMTALWYSSMESGAAGYNEIGGLDIRLNGEYNPNVIPLLPREESTGWTQYAFVVYPADEAVGMEIRLRYWHHFEGATYWDDVSIVPLGGDALVQTAIEDERQASEIPDRIYLEQNYPNPFNPATRIAFELPAQDRVTLEVFSIIGRRVATLVDNQFLQKGRHEVVFDAASLPSGTYLYVLRSAQRTEARSMLLIK